MKWRRWLRLLGAMVLLTVLGWFVLPFAVPLQIGLKENPKSSPVFLDRHGRLLLHLALPDSTRAAPVPFEEIPADLIACTLAAEDKRFNEHGGIDLLATLRAGRDLLSHQRVVSGASTITQQLIKISSPPAKRGPLTKIREALAARHLEMSVVKTTNPRRLSEPPRLRKPSHRCRRGARFYFQKPLCDLSLAECALLAGLPQAPSRLNPIRHPARATVRRNTVLNRLAAIGNQNPARIAAALTELVNLRPLVGKQPAPWLAQIQNPTLQVRTTLDLPLQNDIQAIVREETAKLKEANLRHAAVVVIDNPTGEILALCRRPIGTTRRAARSMGPSSRVPPAPRSSPSPIC